MSAPATMTISHDPPLRHAGGGFVRVVAVSRVPITLGQPILAHGCERQGPAGR
jgi:hypothetical protein